MTSILRHRCQFNCRHSCVYSHTLCIQVKRSNSTQYLTNSICSSCERPQKLLLENFNTFSHSSTQMYVPTYQSGKNRIMPVKRWRECPMCVRARANTRTCTREKKCIHFNPFSLLLFASRFSFPSIPFCSDHACVCPYIQSLIADTIIFPSYSLSLRFSIHSSFRFLFPISLSLLLLLLSLSLLLFIYSFFVSLFFCRLSFFFFFCLFLCCCCFFLLRFFHSNS